jgi:hypothetical protein
MNKTSKLANKPSKYQASSNNIYENVVKKRYDMKQFSIYKVYLPPNANTNNNIPVESNYIITESEIVLMAENSNRLIIE